ncbi:PREDICTED: F-box protein At1g30790-like [Camelina sativa]|uniref:F-box protein At1g30790-like n=1 Tax=Camelina sativa TaxID=90675 RepID=A0ABM0X4P0_CAMSA|nr:PREDICTED: F-box protein At1g30790-like [Camelina sativa]
MTHPQKKLLKRGRNEDDDDQKDKLDPLPTDLEVEILTKLPSKSLMKLRCVSKIWSSIIRSQRFVDSFYAIAFHSLFQTYRYRCPSIHGFVGCANFPTFIVCNPSTKQVITLPIKGVRASLGYDPVGRQFKVLNLVTGAGEFPSYLVHEFITLGAGGEVSRSQVTTASYVHVTDRIYINGSLYSAAWSPKARMNPVVVSHLCVLMLDTRP